MTASRAGSGRVRSFRASLRFWRDGLGFAVVCDRPGHGFAFIDLDGILARLSDALAPLPEAGDKWYRVQEVEKGAAPVLGPRPGPLPSSASLRPWASAWRSENRDCHKFVRSGAPLS